MNEIEVQTIREEAEALQLFVTQSVDWINHHDKADEKTIRMGIWMTTEQGVTSKYSWDNKRIIVSLESKDDWEALKVFARHLTRVESDLAHTQYAEEMHLT